MINKEEKAPSFELVAPRADALMESLRATGYSLPDAVCDLIDNSVTARARNIWLDFHWSGANSHVSVLDDGHGMNQSELVQAMRIGSRSPLEVREPCDLGRYGMGLKTASLSQARSLTVASRTTGRDETNIRRWDLDHLESTRDWQLLTTPPETFSEQVKPLIPLQHGTLVVWNKLDRLFGDAAADNTPAQTQFLRDLRAVEEHVAMVFHRYLAQPNPISIWFNGQRVRPWDPFLADEPATQRLAEETVGPSGAGVRIIPYVLPHNSRLTGDKHRAAGGPAGWNAHQGFYVYRNRRLLLPGDWLGLGFRKEEHYKLARIMVDITNSSDHEWDIDVRKSRAVPPLALRHDLLRIARTTRERAVTVYRHRGKTITRASDKSPVLVWRKRTKGNRVSYEVNREHPLIHHSLTGGPVDAQEMQRVLRLVEEYVPVQQIWMDMNEGDESQTQPFALAEEQELMGLIRALYLALVGTGLTHQEAATRLGETESIGDRFELVEPALETLLRETAGE